jgi:peptide deformylase
MAATEISGSHQSLQILKNLNFKDVNELIYNANIEKFDLDDEVFMHALGATLQSLCELRKGYSLSAVMAGYNANFLVASINGRNFRYFYNLNYTKLGEEAQSLEASINCLDENGYPRRFYCYRSQKIKVVGKELINSKLVDLNEEFTGVYAAVLQHEIENQNYNFLSFYGIEVQVY